MVNFSTPVAIFLTLLAAGMWGSWMQIVKLKKDYPVNGIAFWLYNFSLVLIWGVTLALSKTLLPEGIGHYLKGNGHIVVEILLGGAMMSVGLIFGLNVISKVGLILYTACSGAVGSILGLATSISKEGMPSHPMAMPLIVLCTLAFLAAGVICQQASIYRDMDKAEAAGVPYVKSEGGMSLKFIGILAIGSLLANGWSIGTATGTATGFPPALTCALMATGSFIGSFVVCAVMFTVKKQWKSVLCIGESKRPLLLSMIAATCHYGGNLISIYSMPAISATMSFLFGRSSAVWTYFWGIFYKDFAGSKKRTVIWLTAGLVLYFVAVALLGVFNIAIK